MAEKTAWRDTGIERPRITSDQKACVNCVHARLPNKLDEAIATDRFVECRCGPPSVLLMPAGAGQLAIKSRWPSMAFDEECDAFVSKIRS